MKSVTIVFLLYVSIFLSAQNPQPSRPADFVPYHYRFTVEQLKNKYSDNIMKKAAAERAAMREVIDKGPYKATYESIDNHPLPEWFRDVKFGIFYDWGIYSVAGHGEPGYHDNLYPDCYLCFINDNTNAQEYHKNVWGEDFKRDDFIPLFKATGFDAEKLAQQCVKWGAKYVVPFCRHACDGYSLWDNSYSQRDAVDMYPGRDLVKEMYDAFRKYQLKCGFYTLVYDFEYPVLLNNKILIRTTEATSDPSVNLAGYIPFDSKVDNRMISGKIPVQDYFNDYFVPSTKEFIDRYDPDILWFDAEWYNTAAYNKTDLLTTYFFNNAAGRKEVVVNDRLGTDSREKHGDIYTSEGFVIIENFGHYWEENIPMGFSYGYNWEENDQTLMTAEHLIEMLVRIVARNGNLMLLINPDGQGELSAVQVDRLDEIGKWLEVNGEGIYKTRFAPVQNDPSNSGDNVWYTLSKDEKYIYAHFFEWPEKGSLLFKKLNPKWETDAYLLGYDKPLKWYELSGNEGGIISWLPEGMTEDTAPCKYAWCIRFEWDKDNQYGSGK